MEGILMCILSFVFGFFVGMMSIFLLGAITSIFFIERWRN